MWHVQSSVIKIDFFLFFWREGKGESNSCLYLAPKWLFCALRFNLFQKVLYTKFWGILLFHLWMEKLGQRGNKLIQIIPNAGWVSEEFELVVLKFRYFCHKIEVGEKWSYLKKFFVTAVWYSLEAVYSFYLRIIYTWCSY